MKIYLDQFRPYTEQKLNYHHLVEVFKQNKSVDLILSPELFLTGSDFVNLEERAEENVEHVRNIQSLCELHHTAFAASFLWAEKKKVYNRLLFFARSGEVVAQYDKNHLIPAFREDEFLTPGKKATVLRFEGINVGMSICYDLRFPELFRSYGKQEVELIICVALWPQSRIEHMQLLARTRAIENQCFLAIVNGIGKVQDNHMGGHSMLISPRGEVLTDAGTKLSGKVGQIFAAEVLQYRQEFPALYQYSRK